MRIWGCRDGCQRVGSGLEQAVQAAIALDAPLNERMAVIANAVRSAQHDVRGSSRPDGAAAAGSARRRDRASTGRSNAAVSAPRRERQAGRPGRNPAKRTGGDFFPARALRSLSPVNAIGVAEVEKEITELGGQFVAIVPERRKFTTMLKEEAAAILSLPHRHGQWLCAVAEPGDLGRNGNGDADRGRRLGCAWAIRAMRPGFCRYRLLSSSTPTALSRLAIWIRTIVSAWRLMICWQRSSGLANPKRRPVGCAQQVEQCRCNRRTRGRLRRRQRPAAKYQYRAT